MARQSPGRRNAKEHATNPADPFDEVEEVEDVRDAGEAEDTAATGVDAGEPDPDDPDELADDEAVAGDRSLWTDARIDPVEVALPSGTGYTLRAYRLASVLAPTEAAEPDEDDPFAQRVRRSAVDDEETEDFGAEFTELDQLVEVGEAEPEAGRRRARRGRDEDADEEFEESAEEETELGDEDDEVGEEDDELEEEEEEAEADEEVPVFLSHRGKLLLFRSAESLVTFVRSGAPHDLAQVDTWTDLAERVEPADVSPREEDSYELDLVVENLRGGHDVWDVTLLVKAGEVARDLGYALRLEPVITALAPGSPLDDLDEALRKTADGGLGGFFGRRRLRKIGAQQATLGWRTIIGKISGAVDWRD